MQAISFDNFFEGEFTPDDVRNRGLNIFKDSNLITDGSDRYPGIRKAVPLNIHEYVKKKVSEPISMLLEYEKIPVVENAHWHIMYHLTTSIHEQGLIHTDYPTWIAGVIYLNPNPPKNSGTKFYRIKKEHLGKNLRIGEFSTACVIENEEFLASFGRRKEYYNKRHFEEEKNIENVYNSSILYPGKYIHGAGQYFGETLENSRLCIVIGANIGANANR